jgi:hypothetical protein
MLSASSLNCQVFEKSFLITSSPNYSIKGCEAFLSSYDKGSA